MNKTVMLSNTVRDLPRHRVAARTACLEQGFYPSMMEYLPASSSNAIEVSLQMVDEADMYILILGELPGDEVRSIELKRLFARASILAVKSRICAKKASMLRI